MTTNTRRVHPLTRRRRKLGLSRLELARLAGCSLQSVNLFEQGHVPKRSAALERVEAVLAAKEAER
jgi:transcriptional regulator with XRE-family HTH domain